VDAAIEDAEEALQLARSLASAVLPEALVVLARARMARNQPEVAVATAREAADMARELGRSRTEFLALLVAHEAARSDEVTITRRLDHLASRLAAFLDEARAWLSTRAGREEDTR